MDTDRLKEFLAIKGFKLENGSSNVWSKIYSHLKDYKISVSLKNTNATCIIDWGNSIMENISNEGRKTTCNFKDQETLVVVDCVDRFGRYPFFKTRFL